MRVRRLSSDRGGERRRPNAPPRRRRRRGRRRGKGCAEAAGRDRRPVGGHSTAKAAVRRASIEKIVKVAMEDGDDGVAVGDDSGVCEGEG